MGQIDTSPVPPHAVTMWTDDHDIYILLPMKAGGTPYIMRFSLNEGGLMRALEVLKQRPKEIITPSFDRPANYTREAYEKQAVVKLSKAQERLYGETTPEQRSAAQALLRKLGMVK